MKLSRSTYDSKASSCVCLSVKPLTLRLMKGDYVYSGFGWEGHRRCHEQATWDAWNTMLCEHNGNGDSDYEILRSALIPHDSAQLQHMPMYAQVGLTIWEERLIFQLRTRRFGMRGSTSRCVYCRKRLSTRHLF